MNLIVYNNGRIKNEQEKSLSDNSVEWMFIATTENASLVGDQIVIRASDLPGNVTEEEKSL